MYSDYRVKLEHKLEYSTGSVRKIIVLNNEMCAGLEGMLQKLWLIIILYFKIK